MHWANIKKQLGDSKFTFSPCAFSINGRFGSLPRSEVFHWKFSSWRSGNDYVLRAAFEVHFKNRKPAKKLLRCLSHNSGPVIVHSLAASSATVWIADSARIRLCKNWNSIILSAFYYHQFRFENLLEFQTFSSQQKNPQSPGSSLESTKSRKKALKNLGKSFNGPHLHNPISSVNHSNKFVS